jgi:hypothetical protein
MGSDKEQEDSVEKADMASSDDDEVPLSKLMTSKKNQNADAAVSSKETAEKDDNNADDKEDVSKDDVVPKDGTVSGDQKVEERGGKGSGADVCRADEDGTPMEVDGHELQTEKDPGNSEAHDAADGEPVVSPNADTDEIAVIENSMQMSSEEVRDSIGTNDDKMEIDNSDEERKEPRGSSQSNIQIVEEEGDDGEEDLFMDSLKARQQIAKKPRRKKKQLQIKINVVSPENTTLSNTQATMSDEITHQQDDTLAFSILSHPFSADDVLRFDSEVVEKELEDSLKFFEQPHQDQDPLYAKFRSNETKTKIVLALQRIDADEEAGRKEIEMMVGLQLKEKQMSTEKNFENYKLKMSIEEQKEIARLQEAYAEKVRSNQGKIEQGMLVLRKRHAAENQKLLQQHRQQTQQRRVTPETAQNEWNQLSQRLHLKHQHQIQEFAGKGEEVKKKCESEFQRETAKLRNQFEKRLKDVDANRQSIYSRMYTGFQQLRQRYLKRHAQAMDKRREALRAEEAKESRESKEEDKRSGRDKAKGDLTENEFLRPPSPLKSSAEWYVHTPYEASGAASRHKHRKGVLSQINKQLSVELHNEGLWISQLKIEDANKKKEEGNTSTDTDDDMFFIPWGVQAREVLDSIVCGEIPSAGGCDKFDFGSSVASNGGHLRCVMTDLRTSDETASIQRAEAVLQREQKEILKKETKISDVQSSIASTEKSVDQISKTHKELENKLNENAKDAEKTKNHYQAFRSKFASYFGPGVSRPTFLDCCVALALF